MSITLCRKARVALIGVSIVIGSVTRSHADDTDVAKRIEKVVKSLSKTSVVIDGKVSHRKPSSGSNVMVVSGLDAEPYAGKFTTWLPGDGTFVAVSEKAVPGFGICHTKSNVLVQATYREDAPSLTPFEDELASLLDFDVLAKSIAKATGGAGEKGDTAVVSTTSYQCSLPTSLLKKTRATSPLASLQPRVLKLEARFTLSAGTLSEATFTVVRNDPMAHVIPGRPDGGDGEEAEGAKTTYQLAFKKGPAPKRAQEWKTLAESLLAAEEE